jgi:catalase
VSDVPFADAAIDGIVGAFPGHQPGTRPIHAPGVTATGWFEGSAVAPLYTDAAHFAGDRVPVTVRFSNGTGYPDEPDSEPVVRGMAVTFHLGEVSVDQAGVLHGAVETDMVCMGLPVFFIDTPDRFLELTRAAVPRPVPERSLWRKAKDAVLLRTPLRPLRPADQGMTAFANGYRPARLGVIIASNPFVPESYATCTYRPVHAFVLRAGEATRSVRFTWEPVAGVRPARPAAEVDGRFLRHELAERLALGPAEFVLRMQVAEHGDDTSDPTREWTKATRRRIVMGHLWVDVIAPDQLRAGELRVFDPTRLVPGIELSDDLILRARGDVYRRSQERRMAAGPVVL